MTPVRFRSVSLVALCAVVLLLAQIMGLHHHRHVTLDGGVETHGSELHFDDRGLHRDAHDAEHRHAADGAAMAHPHLDVETPAVGDTVVKVFTDSLLLGLLFVIAALSWPRLVRLPLRPQRSRWRKRLSSFALHPPSQAPPRCPLAVC